MRFYLKRDAEHLKEWKLVIPRQLPMDFANADAAGSTAELERVRSEAGKASAGTLLVGHQMTDGRALPALTTTPPHFQQEHAAIGHELQQW